MFLGSWTMEYERLTELEAFSLTLLARPPLPFDLSLLQSITAAPESVVDEYMTKYHQDCYSTCAEPFRCAGLPVYLDTVMCAVFALLPLPSLPLSFWGFSVGFGLVLFFLLCSKHEVLSTGPL